MIEVDRIELALVELYKHDKLLDYHLLDKIEENIDNPGRLMKIMQENWAKEVENVPPQSSIWDYPVDVVDKAATLARLIREFDERVKG